MKTRIISDSPSRTRTHGHDDGGSKNHGRYWRGGAASSLETCRFCGKAKLRASMIDTADGLYCRQCWMDHWA